MLTSMNKLPFTLRDGGGQVPVRVDGTVVGTTPWEGDLAPGQHTIQLQDAHSRSPTQTLQVALGGKHEVFLEVAADFGRLEIRAMPAQAMIEVDGDSATSVCYLDADSVNLQTGKRSLVGGRYEDRFVRTADGWRIAERRIVIDYASTLPGN